MTTPNLLRSRIGKLTDLARDDLAAVWRRVEQAAEAETALRDVLPGLITAYGAAASVVAAEWYDDLRASKQVRGQFSAIVPEAPPTGAQVLVGWALKEVAKPDDVVAFRSLVEGGMQRRIANHSRFTVMHSSIADPGAQGWMRVGEGQCDFCAELIGRGAVYSESSSDFRSHDHCKCTSVPAFR